MTNPNLDDLLLDIATTIELSNRDRQVTETRYRKLKEYLERPQSPLLPYLANDTAHIYAQGSIAMGTTVVSGTKEDRFDLDAIVEMNIPPEWSLEQPLNLLYQALQGFPDAVKIVKCTRCVQLQFAFMHMDVTVMDPCKGIRIERAGDIFHNPDVGVATRVPSNPYGFSKWFRETVNRDNMIFAKELNKRRMTNGMDRLFHGFSTMDARQDDLPPMLPLRLDSEQVIALKLMKRYLYLRYENRNVKHPPSIYLSKLAAELIDYDLGLFAQLNALGNHIYALMQSYITTSSTPDERNPAYQLDKLNDRWPKSQQDMEILQNDMSNLIKILDQAKISDFKAISEMFSELFGEKVAQQSVLALMGRASSAADSGKNIGYEKDSGAVILSQSSVPEIKKKTRVAPNHNFHCEMINDEKNIVS